MFNFKKNFFVMLDFIIAVLLFIGIFYFRYNLGVFFDLPGRPLTVEMLIQIAIYSFIIVIFSISMKLYEINRVSQIKESIISDLIVSFMSMSVVGAVYFFFKIDFARFVFFFGFIVAPFILSVFNKLIFTVFFRRKRPYQTVFLGTKTSYDLLLELFDDYKKIIDVNVDFINIDEELFRVKEIVSNKDKIDFLIADTDINPDNETLNLLNDFEIGGGRIYSLIDIFTYLDQSIPSKIIKNHHFEMFSTYKLDSVYLRVIKRFGDIMISLLLLIITLPITLITALLVLTSPGGIFYVQKRVGLNGKEFKIYKFRSMVQNAEKNGAQLSTKNDARITWIGRIIRMVRIDELPQLINILKGDMSFIGPRPERMEIMNKIVQEVPLFKKRLLVKPGLTGWAQVKYVYANDISGMDKKLSYDLYYISNVDLRFDLKIVLYTFETIIFRRGAM